MQSFGPARQCDVSNLDNWLNGTPCIARAETDYLANGTDLFRLAIEEDRVVKWSEVLVERV